MAILAAPGVSVEAPFCDWLDFTIPRDCLPELESALLPYLVGLGAAFDTAGLWRVPYLENSPLGVVVCNPQHRTGTVKLDGFGQVARCSMSGAAIHSMRVTGVFAAVLAECSQFSYKVTRLDASLDLPLPGPEAVAAVASAGRDGGLRLGQRAVSPQDVFGKDGLDRRGVLTGTVYLGKKQREIRAMVYDKRHEMESNGLPDVGPRTRIELTLRNVSASFRDACLPAAIFWNYSRSIVQAPPGASDWTAAGAGFDLPERVPPDYWRILCRRVDEWPELSKLGLLADKLGKFGRRMLLGRIALVLGVDVLFGAATDASQAA